MIALIASNGVPRLSLSISISLCLLRTPFIVIPLIHSIKFLLTASIPVKYISEIQAFEYFPETASMHYIYIHLYILSTDFRKHKHFNRVYFSICNSFSCLLQDGYNILILDCVVHTLIV